MKLLSSSNGAISVVAPEQRVTLYDEFNIKVPLDEFSEHGMSAKGRAILVHSHCRIDALLNLSSVVTTYSSRKPGTSHGTTFTRTLPIRLGLLALSSYRS